MFWNVLKRFWTADYGPPPPPDIAQAPVFPDQSIVETLHSASNEKRVFITIDTTGDYRIQYAWWDTSDWKEHGQAFWCTHNTGCHTDNLERARALARETLGKHRQEV